MKALEVLFWISLFIVFYTYIGYGILLYILVKIKECFRKPAPRPMPALLIVDGHCKGRNKKRKMQKNHIRHVFFSSGKR